MLGKREAGSDRDCSRDVRDRRRGGRHEELRRRALAAHGYLSIQVKGA